MKSMFKTATAMFALLASTYPTAFAAESLRCEREIQSIARLIRQTSFPSARLQVVRQGEDESVHFEIGLILKDTAVLYEVVLDNDSASSCMIQSIQLK